MHLLVRVKDQSVAGEDELGGVECGVHGDRSVQEGGRGARDKRQKAGFIAFGGSGVEGDGIGCEGCPVAGQRQRVVARCDRVARQARSLDLEHRMSAAGRTWDYVVNWIQEAGRDVQLHAVTQNLSATVGQRDGVGHVQRSRGSRMDSNLHIGGRLRSLHEHMIEKLNLK